jgi:Cu(I)/Ag(I) efflux system membrane fusion protein
MNSKFAAAAGLAALAGLAMLGYLAVQGGWLANAPPAAGTAQSAHVHAPTAAAATGARKILYYRNPMGLPDTSPVPKKDWMGMDYIAVHEGDEEAGSAGVKVSLDRVQRSGVRTETAELRRLERPIRAPGKAIVDERTLRVVTLRADAFIEKLYVNETGKHVEKGEPLLRIYSPDMVAAQVDYRVATSDRAAQVREASARGAEQKMRNLELPETAIDEMKRTGQPVMSIDWPSPVSGFVMAKGAIEGQKVKAGDELFRIADLSHVWVVADVPEQDIGLVSIGLPAKITFRAYPDRAFEGKVTFILHELDAATRTAKVRIELPNAEHLIKHEMYADVVIEAGAGDAPRIAVPRSAVIDSGHRQVVIVDRGDGRFDPRPVKLGVSGDGFVEVREGIAAGDRVVVSANFLIDAESNLKAALGSFTADSGNSPLPGVEGSGEGGMPKDGVAPNMEHAP